MTPGWLAGPGDQAKNTSLLGNKLVYMNSPIDWGVPQGVTMLVPREFISKSIWHFMIQRVGQRGRSLLIWGCPVSLLHSSSQQGKNYFSATIKARQLVTDIHYMSQTRFLTAACVY